MCQGVVLEDYEPSWSPVSYDVMYLSFLYMVPMFGWDVPSQVDDPLLAMFLFFQNHHDLWCSLWCFTHGEIHSPHRFCLVK